MITQAELYPSARIALMREVNQRLSPLVAQHDEGCAHSVARPTGFRGDPWVGYEELMGRDVQRCRQIKQALIQQPAFAQFNIHQEVPRKARPQGQRFLGEAAACSDLTNPLPHHDANPPPFGNAFRV